MPSGVALIVYEIVSSLTMLAKDCAQWFGIDSLRDCVRIDNDSKVKLSCTWIDTG